MRSLWVNRSNKPSIASLSELFLSLATGTTLIGYHLYVTPLISDQNNVNLQNSIALLLIIAIVKSSILLGCVFFCKSITKEEKQNRRLSFKDLICPGLVKTSAYLAIVILISGARKLNLTVVTASTLVFIFWLHFCSSSNPMTKTLEKGRNYSSNPIKMTLIYLLLITATALQPIEYTFSFELHFQIFIIFTTILLIFSYFYLHKLILTYNPKQKSPTLLLCQALIEIIYLIVVLLYYLFMELDITPATQQLAYISQNWWTILLLSALTILYELTLWEHIKKIALQQLVITITTGFLWFNIYHMTHHDMEIRLYVSVIIMLAVLLTNIGLFSPENFQKIIKLCSPKKPSKKRNSPKDDLNFDNQ